MSSGKMEATKGKETAASIFAEILPPRLEDAGLEDCALPPESIQEAFMKAAFAVKSRASSFLSPSAEDEGGDLVSVPIPDGLSDSVLGAEGEEGADRPCVVEKGGGGEARGDLVAPEVDEGGAGDRVLILGVEGQGKGACVGDGRRGEVDVDSSTDKATEDEGDGDGDVPSLVEGVVRSSV